MMNYQTNSWKQCAISLSGVQTLALQNRKWSRKYLFLSINVDAVEDWWCGKGQVREDQIRGDKRSKVSPSRLWDIRFSSPPMSPAFPLHQKSVSTFLTTFWMKISFPVLQNCCVAANRAVNHSPNSPTPRMHVLTEGMQERGSLLYHIGAHSTLISVDLIFEYWYMFFFMFMPHTVWKYWSTRIKD